MPDELASSGPFLAEGSQTVPGLGVWVGWLPQAYYTGGFSPGTTTELRASVPGSPRTADAGGRGPPQHPGDGGTGPPKADSPGPPSPAHTGRNNLAPDSPAISPSGSAVGGAWGGKRGPGRASARSPRVAVRGGPRRDRPRAWRKAGSHPLPYSRAPAGIVPQCSWSHGGTCIPRIASPRGAGGLSWNLPVRFGWRGMWEGRSGTWSLK